MDALLAPNPVKTAAEKPEAALVRNLLPGFRLTCDDLTVVRAFRNSKTPKGKISVLSRRPDGRELVQHWNPGTRVLISPAR